MIKRVKDTDYTQEGQKSESSDYLLPGKGVKSRIIQHEDKEVNIRIITFGHVNGPFIDSLGLYTMRARKLMVGLNTFWTKE